MSEISFKKVDAAFQNLADDERGQAALREFGQAIERLEKSLPDLNEFEAKYLVASLVEQRKGAHSSTQLKDVGRAKEVHGFVIKSAVTA